MKKYLIGLLLIFTTIIGGVTLVDAKESVPVRITYTSDKTEFTVGETGKLSVEPILGVKPKGTFKPTKDEFIDLKADGTYTTLSIGKTNITPSFELSEESITSIKEAYIKENSLTNVALDDIELAYQDIQSFVTVTIIGKNTGETRDIGSNFKSDTTKLKVGQTGKISVEPLYNIVPKGKFTPEKNEYFELKEDGTFTALKSGEAIIIPNFTIEADSLAEINAAYVRQLESPASGVGGFPMPDIQQKFTLTITEDKKAQKIPLSFNFTANPVSIQVGSSGKLSVEKIFGVEPKGTFTTYKNDFIELKADGTYTGLKVGKAELKPTFKLSAESEKELKEAYIKQSKDTDLTVNDIEFVYPETAPLITISVTEKTATATTSNNTKPSGTNKNLPKTSDSRSTVLLLLGTSSVLLATIGLVVRKK